MSHQGNDEKRERDYENRSYTVGIWDITFYLVDEEGRMLTNEDGSVKEFYHPSLDTGFMADRIDPDDLIEIPNDN